MRTLITLEDRQVEKLDAIAKRRGTSRAQLVREAVERFVGADAQSEADKRRADDENLKAAFGLWKDLDIAADGLEYQLAIRSEWDHRP
ncbi:ribbon-helix-helix domain-containing protein [Sandaracinobacter neustonicus]|uniref:Ribbon-helix-helix domain-containing protein n=1 Tax=Sandaracinobacter neustonicus TaxID=1715348 RepID=A0A501XGM1_9SPHN|nr:ribbon-helix-helix domain-containing protein [Sandaracinobacter neustonicus]TPE59453.1 ribbon-helix-helix domain-containing protein [Sandaracinobacter neustonicus]